MPDSLDKPLWIERFIGGLVIAAIAFGLLSFWNTWDLDLQQKAIAAAALGLVFFLLGRSIWRWIENISLWS